MIKIFGIGHRFLKNPEQVRQRINSSLDYFLALYGEIECISSLACGADILFIEEAIKKKCIVKIILPFQISEYKKDFDAQSITRFNQIIENNNYLVFSNLNSQNEDERVDKYAQTGKSCIDQSSVVLAVWDGESEKGIGGTKYLIDYCLEKNKELHWIKAERVNQKFEQSVKLATLSNRFLKIDGDAVRLKQKYLRTWRLGLISGLLAVLSFAVNLNFISEAPLIKFLLSIMEILFIILSFYLLGGLSNKLKSRFIKARTTTETIRSKLWEEELLHLQGIQSTRVDDLAMREIYSNNLKRQLWSFSDEQSAYQRNRVINFQKKIHLNHNYLLLLKAFFLVTVLGISILEGFHYFIVKHHTGNETGWLKIIEHCLVFLWILIPPIYATIEGVIYYNDWKKNNRTSIKLIEYYNDIKLKIIEQNSMTELMKLKDQLLQSFTFEVNAWKEDQKIKKIESKI
ncbi:MAG: hypothetical protein ACKO7P_10205 [Bacteroidota bacterium]